jgi:hypothetical protein
MLRTDQIVSGGQTGVDQAALAAAIACGIAHGGWAPPGNVCESGSIPTRFRLTQTLHDRSPNAPDVPHSRRTELNVRDSDATLILRPSRARSKSVGTELAAAFAARLGRPLFVCDPWDRECSVSIVSFLDASPIRVLNVAGPRESNSPGIGERAYRVLLDVFSV